MDINGTIGFIVEKHMIRDAMTQPAVNASVSFSKIHIYEMKSMINQSDL